jgi:hypothetical protein
MALCGPYGVGDEVGPRLVLAISTGFIGCCHEAVSLFDYETRKLLG